MLAFCEMHIETDTFKAIKSHLRCFFFFFLFFQTCGDLVYKCKRVVGKPNSSDQFKKIVK